MPTHTLHRPEGHPDAALIEALEPDQLKETSSVPFPRLKLNRASRIAFRVLRIFVLLVTVLVVYVFAVGLRGGL